MAHSMPWYKQCWRVVTAALHHAGNLRSFQQSARSQGLSPSLERAFGISILHVIAKLTVLEDLLHWLCLQEPASLK
jgi:hypothetical protein